MFSQFTSMLDIIEKFLKYEKRKFVRCKFRPFVVLAIRNKCLTQMFLRR